MRYEATNPTFLCFKLLGRHIPSLSMKLRKTHLKKTTTIEPSTASTMVPSLSGLKKPERPSPAPENGTVLDGGKEKTVDEKAIRETAALDKQSNEYPKGMKLGIITAALCLSVFLMALVCISPPHSCTWEL